MDEGDTKAQLVEPKKAAVLEGESGSKVLVVLWKDDTITVCSRFPQSSEHECYSTHGGDKVYYIALAFYSSLGMRVKPVSIEEVGGGESS